MSTRQAQSDQRMKIFGQLKALLKRYEPSFTAKGDSATRYELWSIRDLTIAGRKRSEVFFAGLIIQSTYVGLYFPHRVRTRRDRNKRKRELAKTGTSGYWSMSWRHDRVRS